MEARQLSQFCHIAELTYIESAVRDGAKGHWFSDRKYKRLFLTEQEMFEKLEGRQTSLFNPSAQMGKAGA